LAVGEVERLLLPEATHVLQAQRKEIDRRGCRRAVCRRRRFACTLRHDAAPRMTGLRFRVARSGDLDTPEPIRSRVTSSPLSALSPVASEQAAPLNGGTPDKVVWPVFC